MGDKHVIIIDKSAVDRLFHGIWKFAFVLFVTILGLFALGWVLQALFL
jgi:hypothetical protein